MKTHLIHVLRVSSCIVWHKLKRIQFWKFIYMWREKKINKCQKNVERCHKIILVKQLRIKCAFSIPVFRLEHTSKKSETSPMHNAKTNDLPISSVPPEHVVRAVCPSLSRASVYALAAMLRPKGKKFCQFVHLEIVKLN